MSQLGMLSLLKNGNNLMGFPMTMHGSRSFSQSGSFSPSQISGLVGWWDPDDAATRTMTSSRVTQLNDKSPTGANLTVPSGYVGPVLDTTAITGKTLLSMTSATTGLSTASAALVAVINTDRFTVSAMLQSTGAANAMLWTGTNNSGSNIVAGYVATQARTFPASSILAGVSGETIQTVTVNSTTGFITQYTPNAGSVQGAMDTTLATSFLLGMSGFIIGFNSTYTLGETIVYNREVTPTERQKLEGYIAWKWGQQAKLPAGHPYKTAAP